MLSFFDVICYSSRTGEIFVSSPLATIETPLSLCDAVPPCSVRIPFFFSVLTMKIRVLWNIGSVYRIA